MPTYDAAPISHQDDFVPPPPVPEEPVPEAGPATGPRTPFDPCAAKTCSGTSTQDLESALAHRAQQARRCYDAALGQDSELKGHVGLKVRVASNGAVCAADVTSNDMGTDMVAKCVVNTFRASRSFPAPKGNCVDVNPTRWSFIPGRALSRETAPLDRAGRGRRLRGSGCDGAGRGVQRHGDDADERLPRDERERSGSGAAAGSSSKPRRLCRRTARRTPLPEEDTSPPPARPRRAGSRRHDGRGDTPPDVTASPGGGRARRARFDGGRRPRRPRRRLARRRQRLTFTRGVEAVGSGERVSARCETASREPPFSRPLVASGLVIVPFHERPLAATRAVIAFVAIVACIGARASARARTTSARTANSASRTSIACRAIASPPSALLRQPVLSGSAYPEP